MKCELQMWPCTFLQMMQKNSNLSKLYSVHNGLIYSASRIVNFTLIFCKSKVVANSIFCYIEQYVRLLLKFFLTPTLCASNRCYIF